MKKPPPSDQEIEQRKLKRDLHAFMERLMSFAEEPSLWPLTTQEQAAFIRDTLWRARTIARSEPYLAEAVAIAAENLSLAS